MTMPAAETIPPAGSLDQLTRTDEILLNIYRAILNPNLPNQARKQELINGTMHPYEIVEFKLDGARTDEEKLIDGDHLLAATDGDLTNITIKLNHKGNSAIPLAEFNPVASQFYRIFLTNTAQAGKTLKLFVGREAATEAQTATSVVTTAQRFYLLETDKDSHFTGALAQYAKEDENLAGLMNDDIRITGISIQSDQQLHFKVVFFYKDSFEDTDLDTDEFCGEVDLDIPTYGFQIGGKNQYYMDVRNLHVDYIDQDATKELHVALLNMSATAKSALSNVAMTGAVADDGGATTDETTEANNATANDMTLLPAAPAVNDAYYFAAAGPFDKLTLNIGTPGVGTWTITWEYYNGSSWVALSGVTDDTSGFTAAAGNHDVTFTRPSDWGSLAVAGITGYWIRARVSNYTSITTQPLGTQSWISGYGAVRVGFIYEPRT